MSTHNMKRKKPTSKTAEIRDGSVPRKKLRVTEKPTGRKSVNELILDVSSIFLDRTAEWNALENIGLSAPEISDFKIRHDISDPSNDFERSTPTDVPLLVASGRKYDLGEIVDVCSTRNALASLCLNITSSSPMLLQGPVGCGKTSIVRQIAKNCGRVVDPRFYAIQISEQTDTRVLLGSYRCADIPGQFVWHPGILTQAALNGAWLLMEDLDCGPPDLHSCLRPLLESRKLYIPGRGDMVDVHESFRIFATRRISGKSSLLSGHGGMSSWTNVEKLFVKILVQSHPASELKQIVDMRFPGLITVSSRLLSVYLLMSESGQHINDLEEAHDFSEAPKKISFGRLFSTRDLMKWCERISTYFDVQSETCTLRVFQEALECFCFSLPSMESRLNVAEAIGARLNIPKAKVEFVLLVNKPSLHYQADGLTIGRVTLSQSGKIANDSILRREKAVYCLTKPAGRLLESVAACISRAEPVLLVGETGVGKTASVQFLARETGRRLTVVNINQQSDAMDLLGGYKPLEFKHTVRPVREEFEELFYATFSGDKNANFLHYVSAVYCLTKPAGRLLESVAACISRAEPVLLVGETGVGKTASVQFLARETGRRLTVVNINQQSDAMDLLGGYKPLEFKHTVRPVREEFEELFYATFSGDKNANFLHYVSSCYLVGRWSDLVALMSHPVKPALEKLRKESGSETTAMRWEKLNEKLKHLTVQLKRMDSNLAFAFVEGSLVKALRNGDWILLDEINLATAETLDCLSGIIENFNGDAGILLAGNRSVPKMSTSPKLRNFANEPMGDKPVTAVAGIGDVLGDRLVAKGYDKAYVLFGLFLLFKKDGDLFQMWLKDEIKANSKEATDCFMCLKEWADQNR
ncbi:unnamed protein product [Notodromas monacha]|uniref:Barrier-to-autointegration factor-like protein n=1 Tax=Notodromas monacha TaxID=399045 RepID=A0A7R9BQW8_9CRUS|nr:unnamed protein product [Notodromas monacha]CAG0920042.1 unnamed protein product [Notodromas monacha]